MREGSLRTHLRCVSRFLRGIKAFIFVKTSRNTTYSNGSFCANLCKWNETKDALLLLVSDNSSER